MRRERARDRFGACSFRVILQQVDRRRRRPLIRRCLAGGSACGRRQGRSSPPKGRATRRASGRSFRMNRQRPPSRSSPPEGRKRRARSNRADADCVCCRALRGAAARPGSLCTTMAPLWVDMAPHLCHNGDMDLRPYIESIHRQLAAAAETGGEDARALAERLAAPLEAAVRLALRTRWRRRSRRSLASWRRDRSSCACAAAIRSSS